MKKDQIGRNLAASLDMPAELTSGIPKITITGGGNLLVENHGGICGFSAEEICVSCSFGTIVVNGKNLQLCLLKKDEIEVEGELSSVAFRRERSGKS